MTVNAGIVVTGTEVLTGRIADLNGPWVSQRLAELGVVVSHITVCGDRPEDLLSQLRFLSGHVDLIVTTGGLGPTADDLTVAVVAEFTGRDLEFDDDLYNHISAIVQRWLKRRGRASAPMDDAALDAGIRKQALVPRGALPIPPTGTAPGVAIPATDKLPAVLILPGPPRELQEMWPAALGSAPIAQALAAAAPRREEVIRAYGLSEPELAATLRTAEAAITGFGGLEVTTCMRSGEIEIVTAFDKGAAPTYTQLSELLAREHGATIFSTDGSTIDDLVAAALDGRQIAFAESCTGGMLCSRLVDRAGSSAYVAGGVVSYTNRAKTELLDVPAELIDRLGAVSEPVAAAMAEGALARLHADIAVSTTGVAGPGGGSDEKPVGTVCFGLAMAGRETLTRTVHLPGDRSTVRALSTTVALHMILRALTA